MKKRRFWTLLSAVAILAMVGVCGVASAAEWPTKPITIIVPHAAGGGTDLIARLVFSYAEKILGQKVIIVNKPGAATEIGLTELALSKPDGYTWGFANSPQTQSLPIARKTKFTMESFEPCCNIVYDPGIIVVRTDSQFKSMEEFIGYAKENPGVITIGNTGRGSDDDIAVRLMERETGVKVTQVPFDGAAPLTTALLGGHIAAGAINVTEAVPYVNAQKMRALAVMDEERSHLLPDVPTFKELGYDVISGSARGFSAPKGTPMVIIEKMSLAVKETLDDPDFKKKAEEAYQLIKYMGPAEYKRYLYELQETLKGLYEKSPW
jgi:tripartite-type tricarboxylate transporter receptor subunit TctC